MSTIPVKSCTFPNLSIIVVVNKCANWCCRGCENQVVDVSCLSGPYSFLKNLARLASHLELAELNKDVKHAKHTCQIMSVMSVDVPRVPPARSSPLRAADKAANALPSKRPQGAAYSCP